MTHQAPRRRSEASAWSSLIVEAAPNAMLMINDKGVIVLVNRETETLFGYTRDELMGKRVELLVPERYRAKHPAHVEGFFRDPRARAMGAGRELFGQRKDGSEVPIEIGLNPIAIDEGSFTLAAIIDITERKRADERFRLVVEAAPNAMLMVDRERRITLINRKTEDLFGYSRAELVGQLIEILVPERLRDRHPGFVSSFFSMPKARAMGAGRELFGRRRDGTEVPIEIGLNPIETPDGIYTLAAIIDISERKRADAAHDRLAAIVESSEDAIISKALDGNITSWNRGAERLFGYAASEVLGKSTSLIVPERLFEDEASLIARIREGESIMHYETTRRRKDGSELEVSVTLSPIRSISGDVVGASSIARNITELKQRSAELQRSNAELEQFAYVASHDLQEPLRMVANYTELLAERYRGKLDERADKYIHYASDGARRMQRLVADLLAFSRVGSQGKPLTAVSTMAAVDDVLESLQKLIRESGAKVTVRPLPMVLADETQLRQLFQNLIGNAIKFRSAEAPVIDIEAQLTRNCWSFSVRDNGIGMEMQYSDRIFQMFQRLHESGKYEGSGIGLSIAKRIVERHGGRIWVESSIGLGTTFYFTLQIVPKGAS